MQAVVEASDIVVRRIRSPLARWGSNSAGSLSLPYTLLEAKAAAGLTFDKVFADGASQRDIVSAFEALEDFYILGRCFSSQNRLAALHAAQVYARGGGCVFSMPQLLKSRIVVPGLTSNRDLTRASFIWEVNSLDSLSEEYFLRTAGKHPMVLVLHGDGLFAYGNRSEKNHKRAWPAHWLSRKEELGLLRGQLPDGLEFPLYDYDAFLAGVNDSRFGVLLSLGQANALENDSYNADKLRENPLFLARCGSVELAHSCLDLLKDRPYAEWGLFHVYGWRDANSRGEGGFLQLNDTSFLPPTITCSASFVAVDTSTLRQLIAPIGPGSAELTLEGRVMRVALEV